jgi:hypothetical protein
MYRTSIFNPPDKLSELRREEEQYELYLKDIQEKLENERKVIKRFEDIVIKLLIKNV